MADTCAHTHPDPILSVLSTRKGNIDQYSLPRVMHVNLYSSHHRIPERSLLPTFASAPAFSPRRIPSEISCLVLYEPLEPNYQKQPIRVGTQGGNKFWAPPDRKNAYVRRRDRARLFRWKGGRMTQITTESLDKEHPPYGAATVFTQWRDTNHLLAVTFDAEEKNVGEEYGGWKVLSFRHIPLGPQGTYSEVDVAGDQQQLAAPGSRAWTPQLLPTIYDYDPNPNLPQPVSAGLIGNLPLLFALPAFSAEPYQLPYVLTNCMQPNEWRKHELPHGHEPQRGMVVTVFLDPSNKDWSTKALLDEVHNGNHGPFYGP
ncbi:MAG: hypothetical protein L6R36_006497 [Xanthoria steineri]|nr:MAG: hypothetical protein L6R36_006497 [Xanthoria steineri]